MNITEQLGQIVPGKTYPAHVHIEEKVNDKPCNFDFYLQSYMVGMYCAIHMNGSIVHQTGDHNNSRFVGQLKKDIDKAIKRGATVTIGSILPVKRTS